MEASTASCDASKSRQKSCRSCIRAKRRCDRQIPTCSRCADKKIACLYSKILTKKTGEIDKTRLGARNASMESLAFDGATFSPFSLEMPMDTNYFEMLPMSADTDTPVLLTEPTQDLVASPTEEEIPLDPLLSLMDNSIGTSHEQWLVQFEQQPIVERPNTPAEEEVIKTYDKMAGFCEAIEPWHLYDSKAPLHYLIGRLKHFTNNIATENATPFLHRHLYKDHTPPCLVSCFAVNVLYANRTEANTAMVMRALHNSVKELIDTESSRVVVTPIEKLARTQSLFLYEIIRLLDGDIVLRAQAEKDIPLLRKWLGDLLRVRENLGNLAQLGGDAVERHFPEPWERWIFAESVRRTIMIAYSFIALYNNLRDIDDNEDLDTWSYAHRWTLSKHLWQADSSFEFARAWKEKPQFIITNYSFEHFVKYGRGDDVDDFAEILLSVYMGIDEANEFISAKKTD